MERLKQLRLSGIGGQGLVTAGAILGNAGIIDKKYVSGSDSYGVRVRGGYALSDVVISDEPIVFPHVMEADILIPMSQEAYDNHINIVSTDGVVIYDDQLVVPHAREDIKQIGISATTTAIKELNQKQAASIIMLGVLVAMTRVVSKDAVLRAIRENMNERFHDLNFKAIEIGYNIGEKKWQSLEEPISQ